jgi:phosphohistidine phosphatase SixA
MIRAAGALVWRENLSREIEIAVIHRPKYDDWSLPKGKIEDGETALQCAYREVVEETGLKTTFGRQLGFAQYAEGDLEKRVTFWSAQAGYSENGFTANLEVDALRWLSPEAALALLTHESDKNIVEKFEYTSPRTDTLIILRHATALARGDWDADDSLRPLSELGYQQAEKLIAHLAPFGISELYTSNYTRCVETVTPIAEKLGLPVMQTRELNEEIFELDSGKAIDFANALKQDEKNILICSHNPVIPTMLRGILQAKLKNREIIKLEPGDAWVVHRSHGEIVGLDFLPLHF